MVHAFLFDTRLGDWLLARFERHTGLALVSADQLADQLVPYTPGQAETPEPHTRPAEDLPPVAAFDKAFAER